MAAQETRVDLREVVRVVNLARKAMGMTRISSLRKGVPIESNRCPIARSLDHGTVEVCGPYAFFTDTDQAAKVAAAWETFVDDDMVGCPSVLEEFVSQFDKGYYPELQLADHELAD